jgi:hypothetical protein
LSLERELLELARQRDRATRAALDELIVRGPDYLLRQIRHYMSRQADHGKFRNLRERAIELTQIDEISQELSTNLDFSSGSKLTFKIRLTRNQRGWTVAQFQFHVKLTQPRRVGMVRIHLNATDGYDPLAIPRCHIHVDSSRPHVPFPVSDPRLILHLVCEHIEPDIGLDEEQQSKWT